MKHPNGAVSITEVIICVADPDDVARRYSIYTDEPIQRRGASRVVEFGQSEFGKSRIVIASPDHLQNILPGHAPPAVPFLAGFSVAAHLDVTRRLLEERAIDFQIHEKRVLVRAEDAHGAAVLFENATRG